MKIPVFYTPQQVVLDPVGPSPSARKPAEVVASWQEAGFPIEILEPSPATFDEFCLAHDPKHVGDVLAGKKNNGFGNRLRSVSLSLPWTTGSLLTAARAVLEKKMPVAVSPTSGFHHAGYATCKGFCTLNGLMVTVLALQKGRGTRHMGDIGILDLDEHYGNGTEDIRERRQVSGLRHYTFGGEGHQRGDGEAWLETLPFIVERFRGCEIVLYQAGADPHESDPYSRGILSTEQLYRRDQIVFQGLHRLGVPVVWNLAGGYQEPLRRVLDIHDNTMRACVEVYLGDLANEFTEGRP